MNHCRTQPDTLNLPPALQPGGVIGIVAPSSPPNPERFAHGLEVLRAQGYEVVLGEHVGERYGHLAGSDEARAADLHQMFARPDVDAILCARGGSGSIRLLPLLDYELIAAHPKVFVGYSDITSLQLALLARCGLPTFFAPMIQPDFAREPTAGCLDLLWRLIGCAEPAGLVEDSRCAQAITLTGGVAEGPLVGGTLSLLAATLGTCYQPDLRGRILFIEDVHESPARMERYLQQLRLAGMLETVAGIVLGHAEYEATPQEAASYLPIEQVYTDLLEPLGVPVVYNFPVGHVPHPAAIPQGIPARLDADRRELTILAAAVQGGAAAAA